MQSAGSAYKASDCSPPEWLSCVGTSGRGIRVIGAGCGDILSDESFGAGALSCEEGCFLSCVLSLFSRMSTILVASGILGRGE